jgi:hypothetical protein
MHTDTMIDGSLVSAASMSLGYVMSSLKYSYHHFLFTSKLDTNFMNVLYLDYFKTLV